MTKHILTEAEKEAQYDALKNGSAYMKALRAEIDAAPDRDTKSRLILRMADQILADDTIAILEEIDGGEGAPAAPTVPGVTLIKHDADWYEYEAGTASIGIEEGRPSTMLGAGQLFEYLDRPERVGSFFNDLYTLLSEPAVQRYLNIRPAPTPA